MFHPDGPSFFELAHQALSSTEKGYDLLAPKFDFTPFRTPHSVLSGLTRHLREGPDVRRAVDVCCGTGAVMQALLPVVRDEVVGVDFSNGMLEEARRRVVTPENGPAVRLVKHDVFAGPAEAGFDVATCFGALGHVPYGRERALLRSVRAMLRPGGRFLFPSAPMPPRFSPAFLLGKGFNAAMHVRNALLRPPFVMFYLRFVLPEAIRWLETEGFSVRLYKDLFDAPFEAYSLVEARREDDDPRS